MSIDAARLDRIDAVVIGASAGGVQALSEILPAFVAESKLAVLVVLHLPRDRPSLLVDVFSPKCALQVVEAEDKQPVIPGAVYFAPPNYHLLVDDGPQLALSADDLVNHSRPSIDVLFESAADVYRDRLLGIILTGANDDGTAGLAAVGNAGGLTLVQEPRTAQCPTMILSALARRAADRVLPLADMARLLREMGASTRSEA